MALVSRRADDGRTAASTSRAVIAGGAGVAVAAGRAVRRVRVRADARGGVADTRHVALIQRRADLVRAARARSCLASLARGAGVAVIAGGAVRRVRVRADARGGVANTRHVALIQRRADRGLAARAGACLTSLARGAGVVVIAGRAFRRVRVRADARGGVANTRYVALIQRRADRRRAARARPCLTSLARRAGVV